MCLYVASCITFLFLRRHCSWSNTGWWFSREVGCMCSLFALWNGFECNGGTLPVLIPKNTHYFRHSNWCKTMSSRRLDGWDTELASSVCAYQTFQLYLTSLVRDDSDESEEESDLDEEIIVDDGEDFSTEEKLVDQQVWWICCWVVKFRCLRRNRLFRLRLQIRRILRRETTTTMEFTTCGEIYNQHYLVDFIYIVTQS